MDYGLELIHIHTAGKLKPTWLIFGPMLIIIAFIIIVVITTIIIIICTQFFFIFLPIDDWIKPGRLPLDIYSEELKIEIWLDLLACW